MFHVEPYFLVAQYIYSMEYEGEERQKEYSFSNLTWMKEYLSTNNMEYEIGCALIPLS